MGTNQDQEQSILDQLVTPEEVQRQRDLLERVGDAFGVEDELLRAMLANQVLLGQFAETGDTGRTVELLRAIEGVNENISRLGDDIESLQSEIESFREQEAGIPPETREVTDRLDQLISAFGDVPPPSPTPQTMPVGSIGIALKNIATGKQGPAVFRPGGGRSRLTVIAEEDVDSSDFVEVIRQDDEENLSVVTEAEQGQAMFDGLVIDTASSVEVGGSGSVITLDDGQGQTFRVDTIGATDVVMFIDNGTTGDQPAQYDLTQRVTVDAFEEDMFYDTSTGLTKRSVVDGAVPPVWEASITNTSGNDNQDYRVALLAIRRSG